MINTLTELLFMRVITIKIICPKKIDDVVEKGVFEFMMWLKWGGLILLALLVVVCNNTWNICKIFAKLMT